MVFSSQKTSPVVEREVCNIVEAGRKRRYYLVGTRFTLLTDQKSVSFMFDRSYQRKLKNDKIQH